MNAMLRKRLLGNKPERINIDIMSGGVFLATLRAPMPDISIVDDGELVISYTRLKKYIESKRPTLKYRKYEIYL